MTGIKKTLIIVLQSFFKIVVAIKDCKLEDFYNRKFDKLIKNVRAQLINDWWLASSPSIYLSAISNKSSQPFCQNNNCIKIIFKIGGLETLTLWGSVAAIWSKIVKPRWLMIIDNWLSHFLFIISQRYQIINIQKNIDWSLKN